MIERPLWLERVRQAWTQRSVVWLSGVRRVGKTTIARRKTDQAGPQRTAAALEPALREHEIGHVRAFRAELASKAGSSASVDENFSCGFPVHLRNTAEFSPSAPT